MPDWVKVTLICFCGVATLIGGCLFVYFAYRFAFSEQNIWAAIALVLSVIVFAILLVATTFVASILMGDHVLAPTVAFGKVIGGLMQSSGFYFLAGVLFLAAAFWSQAIENNSTLTFMLALLGIAILLYGTGSQAVLALGQGGGGLSVSKETIETVLKDKLKDANSAGDVAALILDINKRPTGQYANFAVAGGAAALTAFFGWGITEKRGEIRDVFRDHTRYDLVSIVSVPTVNLAEYQIAVTLQDGQALFSRSGRNNLYVWVPEEMSKRAPVFSVRFTRVPVSTIFTQTGAPQSAFDDTFVKDVALKLGCAVSEDNEALNQVNDVYSLEVPVRKWSCRVELPLKVETPSQVAVKNEKGDPVRDANGRDVTITNFSIR